MPAANSEAQSLQESLGVRAAYISWIVRGFSPPILRTWVQKSTLLLQNRGHVEVLKKTPSSAKYVTRVRPPSVPEFPPPPPGGIDRIVSSGAFGYYVSGEARTSFKSTCSIISWYYTGAPQAFANVLALKNKEKTKLSAETMYPCFYIQGYMLLALILCSSFIFQGQDVGKSLCTNIQREQMNWLLFLFSGISGFQLSSPFLPS